jgi:hypothetical protein
LTYEAEYLAAILSFLPKMRSVPVEEEAPLSKASFVQALRKSSSMEAETPS